MNCTRARYVGRTPVETSRMQGALQQWIAAVPGTPAEVSRSGRVLRFRSCDPGSKAKVGKDASIRALNLATVRTGLGVGLLRSGVPENLAGCLAGRLVRVYPVRKLADPSFGAGDPVVAARVRTLAARCR